MLSQTAKPAPCGILQNSAGAQDVPYPGHGSHWSCSVPLPLTNTALLLLKPRPKCNQRKASHCSSHQWDFNQEAFMSTKTHICFMHWHQVNMEKCCVRKLSSCLQQKLKSGNPSNLRLNEGLADSCLTM